MKAHFSLDASDVITAWSNYFDKTYPQFWRIRLKTQQPPEIFYKKSYSENFLNIHRKTLVLEYLFNKVRGLIVWNFIKRDFNTGAFFFFLFENIAKFLRTPFSQSTSGRLLLDIKQRFFWRRVLEVFK